MLLHWVTASSCPGDVLLFQVAFFTGFPDAGINALLVDGPDACCRDFQGDETVLFRHKKTLGLKVRVKPSLGLYIRMRNMMSDDHFLPGDFTDPCHNLLFVNSFPKTGVQRSEENLNLQSIYVFFNRRAARFHHLLYHGI